MERETRSVRGGAERGTGICPSRDSMRNSMRDYLNTALYGAKRSAIRRYAALARETPGCLSLTLGEPDFDTPAPAVEAARAALSGGQTHYISNNGTTALLEAISRHERQAHKLRYAPDEIIVTAGATEALFLALFGTLNPGDEVIVPVPAFVLYEEIIRLCRATPVLLDTAPDGFQINPARLVALIGPRTKALILNSPNNPTGSVYSWESLQSLAALLLRRETPLFVICDEVYRDLSYGPEPVRGFPEALEAAAAALGMAEPEAEQAARERVLLVQSFSKPYAMTGWRMGYLMADAAVKERLELLHQFMVVSTPAPFQDACIAALECDVSPMRERFRARRDYVLSRLEGMGLEAPAPDGAFYVFPSIRRFGLSSEEFCERMIREAGVAATPGACFGGEGHIRLSYSCAETVLQEGMDRLERFCTRIQQEGSA